MRKKIKSFECLLVALPIVVFFLVFLTVSLHRYWQYATWYYDFGIFYRAISAVSQGQLPIIDHFIFTDKIILADHFHPIIFLVSPFVAIFKTGETLLVFQTLFVSLSAVFVYLTAKSILKDKKEALIILIIYLSFIGLHNALITEFHEITLLPLPLSIFFYGMVKKKTRWLTLGLIGVLLTKESTFVITAWFGLFMFMREKALWKKIGLYVLASSLLYGLVLFVVIFPLLSDRGSYYLSIFTSESQLEPLLTQFKLKTILKTFAGFGFLPLLSPETLPPVLINWFSRFSSAGATRHDLGMHYNAELAPTLILASTYGYKRIKQYLDSKKIFVNRNWRKYFLPIIACGCLFLNIWVYKSPALLFFNKDFYAHTKNFQFLDKLVEAVPTEGVVMAQTNIAAKLASRHVYMLRDNYKQFDPDYIVVDIRDGQEPNNFLGIKDFEKLINSLQNDSDYEIFYEAGEQMIYKKVEE